MTELSIIIILLAIYYAWFILRLSSGLRKLKAYQKFTDLHPMVSVVIAFKDEERKLLALLESLSKQEYPSDKLEIIFVNDASADNSVNIIKEFNSIENLILLNSNNINESFGKKVALKTGVEFAKGEIILLTDADCKMGPKWISSMAAPFKNEDTGFVAGPVKISTGKNYFTVFESLDFGGLMVASAGLIGLKTPTIASGANIAYRKEAYELAGGFKDAMKFTSGDDEAIMHAIDKNTNFDVLFNPDHDAIVYTDSLGTLKGFIEQRKRWASKGFNYTNYFMILQLIGIFLFFIAFVISPFLGLFINHLYLLAFAIMFVIKTVADFLTLKTGYKIIYGETKLKGFLIAELFHPVYIVFSTLTGIFAGYNWKGRRVKK